MSGVWVFLAFLAVVILLWILSRKNSTPSFTPAPVSSTKPGLQVVNTNQEDQLQGQGIIVQPGTQPTDQFGNRVTKTLLLADAPPEVRQELLSGLKVARLQGLELPDNFDSRQKWPGLITVPMEQGNCGSCWAFATAATISDRYRIANPNTEELRTLIDYSPYGTRNITYRILNNLDPYELVYCDVCQLTENELPETNDYLAGPNGECDQGCEGGFVIQAYRYVRTNGLSALLCNRPSCNPVTTTCPCNRNSTTCATYDCTMVNDQYQCKCFNNGPEALNANCQSLSIVAPIEPITQTQKTIYKPKDIYSVVSPNDPPTIRRRKIQEDVFQYGPVTVGFQVYRSFYEFFKTNPDGIYTRQIGGIAGDEKLGGHAVSIIGWGSEPVFHWIVRNSWSPIWAGDGHFKIQYDFGGIMDQVMAAEF